MCVIFKACLVLPPHLTLTTVTESSCLCWGLCLLANICKGQYHGGTKAASSETGKSFVPLWWTLPKGSWQCSVLPRPLGITINTESALVAILKDDVGDGFDLPCWRVNRGFGLPTPYLSQEPWIYSTIPRITAKGWDIYTESLLPVVPVPACSMIPCGAMLTLPHPNTLYSVDAMEAGVETHGS